MISSIRLDLLLWLRRNLLVVVSAPAILVPSLALAQDPAEILKGMYDYIGSQKNVTISYDTDIEIVTPNIQKVQFASSGQIVMSRPDKIRATRTGGYADVELVFDGKVASIAGKNVNVFAQLETPGTIDDLVSRLRNESGLDMPGADLLLTHGYENMMADAIEGAHIGRGVIDGVECEHLAFRGDEVDWQIWIEVGARPIPRKYVITSKTVTGAPQYTVRIKDWKSDAQVAADAFSFKPTADMKKIELSAFENEDEIPQGTPAKHLANQGGSK